jgi:hypothetical protein
MTRKRESEKQNAIQSLAKRLREVRTDFCGQRGGPEFASRLGVPTQTWYNYEIGVIVPAEVILSVIEHTSVDPAWLLRGEGEKYGARTIGPMSDPRSAAHPPSGLAEQVSESVEPRSLRIKLWREPSE